jgi:hypothetical protein
MTDTVKINRYSWLDYLIDRLENWKFNTAAAYIEGEDNQRSRLNDELKEAIRLLSRLYGNSGWFEGDMGALVRVYVDKVVTDLKALHIE